MEFYLYPSSSSCSLEELAQHTDSVHRKILMLINKVKNVAERGRVRIISEQILTKLPEVESISLQFHQVTKVRKRHAKGNI